jgi:hypothetical protein
MLDVGYRMSDVGCVEWFFRRGNISGLVTGGRKSPTKILNLLSAYGEIYRTVYSL